MIATGRVAFANARVRAMKARLLGREIAGRVTAGLGASHDAPLGRGRGIEELVEWYIAILDSYPRGQPLFLALLRRHEVENIKLLWRVIVNDAAASGWERHWVELGRLATLSIDTARDCHTLPLLIERLHATPYAAIARDMWRAHGGDPAAAELGFDRWASQRIVDGTVRLPSADHLAIQIALALVRERDFNTARRAAAAGLPALATAWPREWRRRAPPTSDRDRLALWLRRERYRLCRQAFLAAPFCLAPAVALLLLKEEEIRGLESLGLFDASAADAAWLNYALAASALGA